MLRGFGEPTRELGFVQILVPEDFADTAIDLLEEADRGKFLIDGSEET